MIITRNEIGATLELSRVAEKIDKKTGKASPNSGREYFSLGADIPLGDILVWLGDGLSESILRGSIDTVLQRKWFESKAIVMKRLEKRQVVIDPDNEKQVEEISIAIQREFRTSVLDWKPKQRLDDWTREFNRLTALLKGASPEDKKSIKRKIALHLATQEEEEEE